MFDNHKQSTEVRGGKICAQIPISSLLIEAPRIWTPLSRPIPKISASVPWENPLKVLVPFRCEFPSQLLKTSRSNGEGISILYACYRKIMMTFFLISHSFRDLLGIDPVRHWKGGGGGGGGEKKSGFLQ